MKSYILRVLICFFSCISTGFAQTTVGLPVQFIQFFKTYALVNPASIGSDSAIDLSVGNKSLMGAFSGVRTFYANANMPLKTFDEQKSNHMLGLTFINDQEGSFINRNRLSLLYAVRIPLNWRTSFNAGFAAGFINYAFESSNIIAGGSVWAPNADIGLWLHRSDFNFGVSGNQIIPAKLSPLDQTYTIKRHYNIIAEKTFNTGPYFSIRPAAVFRWQDNKNYNVDAGLIALLHNTVSIATAYKYPRGASFSLGLENVRVGDNLMRAMFSYYTPMSSRNTVVHPQSFELSLNFLAFRK